MFGIILLTVFFGSVFFGLYCMYTAAAASNLAGMTLSGVSAVITAVIVDGYTHLSLMLNRCIAMTAGVGEWVFMLGLCSVILVMAHNALTTHGRTLVR